MENKRKIITPLQKLKTAKHISPGIFERKTPKIHIELLEFLNKTSKFKAITMARDMGKTTVVNKIDVFCDIFYNHQRYTQIYSATSLKASKFLDGLKGMIGNAMRLGYDIKKGKFWSTTQIEIIIDGKYKCFLEVFGAGQDPRGGNYEDSRPTKQIFDDVESKVGNYSVKTKATRAKLVEWFWGDCVPSLDPTIGEIIVIGTILHEDSLLNNFLNDKRFLTFYGPKIRNGQATWKDRHPLTQAEKEILQNDIYEKTGKKRDIESLEDIRAEYKKNNQLSLFYQEHLCQAQSEEARLFKQEDFKYFSRVEYSEKVTYIKFKNAKEFKTVPIRKPLNIILENDTKIAIDNTIRYSTMDLASTGKDKSVIITCCYDTNNNMYIVDISCGHWTPFDKSINAIRIYKEFTPLKFGIEKGGMQNEYFYTIDEAQKAMNVKIPVAPLSHGGVNKNIRISNLQPLFMARKIFLNDNDPNTSLLESQFLAFDIDIEGSHDDLIDTLAYQHHFIKGRTFEDEEYEEYEGTVW